MAIFAFEKDMRKGDCEKCPCTCAYFNEVDMYPTIECGIDNKPTATIGFRDDCPLMELDYDDDYPFGFECDSDEEVEDAFRE